MPKKFNSSQNKQLDELVEQHVIITGTGEDEIVRASVPCYVIVILARDLGIVVSEPTVLRRQLALGIFAFPKGGTRDGAGRPKGSTTGSAKKAFIRHKLSITTADLIARCRSVYDCSRDTGSFKLRGECKGNKTHDLPTRFTPEKMSVQS
jgi:hypothetical protein